jgi:LacI family transcriptional regulator
MPISERRSIAVILPLSVGHARGILEGITDTLRGRRDLWINVTDVGPGATAFESGPTPSGVLAFLFNKADEERILKLGVPAVSLANTLRNPRLPSVHFDDRAAGRLAAEHLLDCGLRHFAFLGDLDFPCIAERLMGYRDALGQKGFGCTLLRWSRVMENWRYFDPTELIWELSELPKPVGLFAPYDLLAYHVARASHHGGLAVPEEIAIIGVDNDAAICNVSQPPLTSVRIPARAIGARAAELLESLLGGQPAPTEPILLAPMPPEVRMSTDIIAVPDAKVARALKYIRTHAPEPIGVTQVWDALRLDRKEMEHRFRQALGRSAGQEFTRVRIDRAKQLLLDTDESVAAIAQACGFATASYLITVFRKHTKVTPQAFRETWRGRKGA